MANTGYENFVLESRLTDLLNTKMDTRSFMTIDDSLEGVPGMKKTINVYTFTGQVEKLEKGSGNSDRGAVSFSKKDYKVELEQQAFDYFDEEFMMDPNIVDMGLQGSAQLMINAANTKFFEELAKASLEHQYSDALKYDDIVDAIALLKLEDESLIPNEIVTLEDIFYGTHANFTSRIFGGDQFSVYTFDYKPFQAFKNEDEPCYYHYLNDFLKRQLV